MNIPVLTEQNWQVVWKKKNREVVVDTKNEIFIF